ncbi:TetR/AcrR family transcriptional regulator [Moraxella catarrhalis]|nr:TetR/AcrR family transcriptional regulator [Moraxella catarrhalis]RKL87845.1 TetR/AcrR family transcriptional regulator [Moraxella catarrhalis]RKL89220.1 TetR/AcrR family transcriptional regulator [Moraxella catarrhalis]RKM00146.1 TetR/AcrR family transcriptional regulator [Moraxella catarrhalis]
MRILQTAEQLLLDSGEGDLTLDSLALTLDLAKGTLYKHFASKDELLLRILIDYEKRKLDMIIVEDGAGAGVARLVLQLVNLPHRAILFNHIEERLSSTTSGLNKMFAQLYHVRRERMVRMSCIVQRYLTEQNSQMNIRDYMATLYAVGQGGASLLNSSFYQRYLGRRDTLKSALVRQMLDLPKLYPKADNEPADEISQRLLATSQDMSEAEILELAEAIGQTIMP